MRKNFVERLKLIIEKNFEGKWTLLAKKANISPGSFKRYLDGTAKPGFEQLIRICEVSNVNPTWLLTGKGPMLFCEEGTFTGEDDISPEVKKALKSHPLIEKIVFMLAEMDEEDLRDIFKRVEEKILLKQVLKELEILKQKVSRE